MGKRQRDCADCGAPVGFLGRQLCCRCMRRLAEDAAKAPCPGCGKQRILQDGTGRCVACSRACVNCGHPVRSRETTLCRDCRRGVRQQAARQDCLKCGRPGLLREVTGWCGHCSRPRQGKWPPRVCSGCGELRRHAAAGLCSACWQRHPDRPFVRGSNLAARLARPPDWLGDFIAHLAARHGPARACTVITVLGRCWKMSTPTIRRPYWSVPAAPDGRWAPSPGPWRASSPPGAWRCRPTRTNGSPPDDAGAGSTPSLRPLRPGCRSVRHVHAPSPGTRPASRHQAPCRRDDRDRAGNHPRLRPAWTPRAS